MPEINKDNQWFYLGEMRGDIKAIRQRLDNLPCETRGTEIVAIQRQLNSKGSGNPGDNPGAKSNGPAIKSKKGAAILTGTGGTGLLIGLLIREAIPLAKKAAELYLTK